MLLYVYIYILKTFYCSKCDRKTDSSLTLNHNMQWVYFFQYILKTHAISSRLKKNQYLSFVRVSAGTKIPQKIKVHWVLLLSKFPGNVSTVTETEFMDMFPRKAIFLLFVIYTEMHHSIHLQTKPLLYHLTLSVTIKFQSRKFPIL